MTEIRDELWLRAADGTLTQSGVNIPVTRFDWALGENGYHVLRAAGPLGGNDDLDPALLVLDARLEVHRFLDGQSLGVEGDTQFLLRFWDFGEDSTGAVTWTIEAYSPEYAMTGRIVDSFASLENDTNPLTTKTGAGDNLIKAWVRENIGTSATPAARQVDDLTVEVNTSQAVSTSKSVAWDNLLAVLQDLADDGAYLGKWLSFGMTASGEGSGFTFRTWANQRGQDHTAGTQDEVIVSKAMGNLRAPRVSFDHRSEITAVRALGRGEGRARATVRVEDTQRSQASPWAYREAKIESQAETTATLTAEANAALQRGRPVRGFSGKLLDSDYARYGERVKFGDLVTAEAFGYSFACRLSTVKGTWSRQGEVLDIALVGSVVE
jgi:hypothetical protein